MIEGASFGNRGIPFYLYCKMHIASLGLATAGYVMIMIQVIGRLKLMIPGPLTFNCALFPSCSWSNDGGLEVDMSKIQVKEKIGEGSYGVVHKAAIENIK